MELIKRLFKNSRIRVCVPILFALVVVAISAPGIAPQNPFSTNSLQVCRPPSFEHLAGTDSFGRDIFSRVIFGLRISLIVASLTSGIGASFGIIFGTIAVQFKQLDNLIMRFMDALLAFPSIILALAIVAILRPSLEGVVIALSITYIPRMTRIVRGASIQIMENEYVLATRAIGSSNIRITLKHILPNMAAEVIVQSSFMFATAILGEAVLSFLGAGPPPPSPSLGNILSEARDFIYLDPWMPIMPGVMIMIVVLTVNVLGDGLRDVLDPKVKSGTER
ncbi:MAG: ABC transporter permease [Petrotogales bacterium]